MATRYRIIAEPCVACGACLPECPVEAISEGEPYTIDPEICNGCGACPSACPTEAIESFEYGDPDPVVPKTGLILGLTLGLKDSV